MIERASAPELPRIEPPPADHCWARARRSGVLAGLSPQRAAAVLKLDVTQGNVQPVPIAIPDFIGGRAAGSRRPVAT